MNVANQIIQIVAARLAPQYLELDNESDQHGGPATDSHFRLVLVSPLFAGKAAVARHQMVYAEMTDLLDGPLHALAMHLYTPEEWAEAGEEAPESPACRGGSASEKEP